MLKIMFLFLLKKVFTFSIFYIKKKIFVNFIPVIVDFFCQANYSFY